ncbi:DNA repair protein [Epithele typhae]|uniref:DNA repair protein n=1 Tax=Epithele typhae TaxID=378194 RepID=UPI0020080361|nr:DNA repair protein [Epithele typhae]KAH9911670.1 DNA repair protein [Epithele typhae]
MPRSTQGSTQSSDYYDDDPDFLKAISELPLPGIDNAPQVSANGISAGPANEPPLAQQPRKRSRDDDDAFIDEDEDAAQYHTGISAVDAHADDGGEYLEGHTYGPSRFGEWGEYMSRKRAKLQVQNAQIQDSEDVEGENVVKSRLFSGLQIYINGWTEPSIQDLRKLIVQNGGIFHAYLDKKSLVTHILTCSLTPAKVREFQHMKVVRPDWLVESLKAGTLLPWQDFLFHPGERAENAQGRKVAQKSLANFVSQAPQITAQPSAVPSRPDPPRPTTPPKSVQMGKGKARASNPPAPTTPSRAHAPPGLYTAASPEGAAHIPGYAADRSNPHATRAMADPAWRAAHTSVAPDFIQGYYRNSRLHHLSTWKAELKNLVAEAQERAERGDAGKAGEGEDAPRAEERSQSAGLEAVDRVVRENMGGHGLGSAGLQGDVSMRGARLQKGKGKGKAGAGEERVIMHCDFDSFFVSAGLIERPHLRGKPVVVCHSQGSTGGTSSTSEIASASYEAREFGIKGGMSLQQARKLCPSVVTIPYEFQKYKQFSLKFYTILMAHADDLQAVSVDEALIDVSSSVARIRTEIADRTDAGAEVSEPSDPAKDFAEAIRAQVRKATGCEISIGIANNIMLARLASRRAKPGGSFHLRQDGVSEFLAPLDIDKLHGFGWSARQKAEEKLGTTNLGELAQKSRATLCEALGKSTGEMLYKALRGIDERQLESDKPRKSVSCDINYGIRFENNEQAETFVFQMAEEVARRLKAIDKRGRSLTLKVMVRDPEAPVEAPKFLGHGMCLSHNKQAPIVAPGGGATSDDKVIGEHAWRLLKAFSFDPKELRGISIQMQKLENASGPREAEHGQQCYQPPNARSPGVNLELPSFSQVDMSVFEALPDDVRKELEDEYKRRSATPAPPANPMPPPKRSPRSRAPLSQTRRLFAKRVYASSVAVSDRELRGYGFDPAVFAALPPEVRREQLAAHRAPGVTLHLAARKPLKPHRGPKKGVAGGYIVPRPPPPRAVFPHRPALKQQGPAPGERLAFCETEDVQAVVGRWVAGFAEHPPNARDVEYFAKFLVQSVDGERSGDTGVQRAVAVAKWWLVLLRRHFGVWEHVQEEDSEAPRPARMTSEYVGRAWWKAFREVKARMDAVARQRFGGCLSLK